MRTLTSRAIATAAAAAIVLTTMSLQPAAAGSRRGDDAVALAIFAGMVGTVAAIIASQQHEGHDPRYGYAPGGYGPGYGGPRYGHPHYLPQGLVPHRPRW